MAGVCSDAKSEYGDDLSCTLRDSSTDEKYQDRSANSADLRPRWVRFVAPAKNTKFSASADKGEAKHRLSRSVQLY